VNKASKAQTTKQSDSLDTNYKRKKMRRKSQGIHLKEFWIVDLSFKEFALNGDTRSTLPRGPSFFQFLPS